MWQNPESGQSAKLPGGVIVPEPLTPSWAPSVIRWVPSVAIEAFTPATVVALVFLTQMQRYSLSPAEASALVTLSSPNSLPKTSDRSTVAVPDRTAALVRVTRTYLLAPPVPPP